MTHKKLEEFSTEQLWEEVKRRTVTKILEKPKAKKPFDFDPLIDICESYVNEAWDKPYIDEDLAHYIFETAMTCVFGEGIFEKINEHRRNK